MNMNETVWNQVLEKMASNLTKPSFETWIKPTSLHNVDEVNNILTIYSINEFSRDWIESRYQSLFEETIFEITNQKYRLIFLSDDSNTNKFQKESLASANSTDEQLLLAMSELNKITVPKNTVNLNVIKVMFRQIIENQQRTNELLEQLLNK